MKLRILNEFGNPFQLHKADAIKVLFPYEDGRVLEKNQVKIIDSAKALIEVELSEFEIDGMAVGAGQSFKAEVLVGDTVFIVSFAKGLNVEMREGKKVLL